MNKKYLTEEAKKLAQREQNKKYYQNHKEEIKKNVKKYQKNHKEEKIIRENEYYQNHKEKRKRYLQKNEDIIKLKRKEYNKKRRKKLNIYQRKYNKKNRKKINEYIAKKIITNINFKLAKNLRSRLRMAIKKNQKIGSAIESLGCSIPELKTYLESKFREGMSWENWSRTGWHIDHIIPVVSFNLQDKNQFLIANHYTNLQPMWAEENLKKGSK